MVSSVILPEHLADLRRSGLSDETIEAAGLYSETDGAKVSQLLNWKPGQNGLGPCLVFPYRNAEGDLTEYHRLKPAKPRTKDRKLAKYESPKGSSNRAYFPPGTLAALQDPSIPLVLTEGEKKAAKTDQEGFPCVGLAGVYGWQRKRIKDKNGEPQGERELIPDLAAIPWQGRSVYVCFDSDAATNAHVPRADWHLAEVVIRHGAIVRVVRLPQGDPGPDGTPAKVGLDDYLVVHGPDAFRELLSAAVEATPPEKGLAPLEAPDDPHRLARLFIRESCQHTDGLILRYYREEWQRWDGSAYRIVPEKELRAELTVSAKAEMDRINLIAQKLAEKKPLPEVRKVTGRLIGDVTHALASLTVLPSRTEAPAWIGNDGPFPASEILACRNALIHLPSLVASERYFTRPTPRLFSTTCLDFDFWLSRPICNHWFSAMVGI